MVSRLDRNVGRVIDLVRELQTAIEAAEAELDALITTWRQARRESIEARDVSRAAYEAKLTELNQLWQAASVPVLVNAMTAESWQPAWQAYSSRQNQWELERENHRRARAGVLEELTVEEVSVDFGGVVKDGKIFIYHPNLNHLKFSVQLLVCVGIVTVVWVVTTLVTRPANKETLRDFYRLCHPGGPGWRKVVQDAMDDGVDIDPKNAIGDWKLPIQILCVFLGCVAIYMSLFAVGNFIYGNIVWGLVLVGVALAATVALFKLFTKIGVESGNEDVNVKEDSYCP